MTRYSNLVSYRGTLEIFKEDQTNNLCTGTQNNLFTLLSMSGTPQVLIYLDCTKYNEIKTHFWHAEKLIHNRIWRELHS